MKKLAILSGIFLFACNTPTKRLTNLQHEFLHKLANQDYFEIKTDKETYFLPLPSAQYQPDQRAAAELLQEEANALTQMALSADQRQQLDIIHRALSDFLSASSDAFGDPGRFVVSDLLQKAQKQRDGNFILEKIPEYYRELENRWQVPSVPKASRAMEKARLSLEVLRTMEEKAGGKASEQIVRAQYALKDFIGLCQSAQLNVD